ncbi:hypothetical protein C8Q74DRAFT_376351 [Fomes fomentarius]|nr:hypothetical protein C8Q74DRAFT_376351 [Fomes fomentarius]
MSSSHSSESESASSSYSESDSDHDARSNDLLVYIVRFTVKLGKTERTLEIPDALRMRVAAEEYTWKLYTSDKLPANTCGLMGDVWIMARRLQVFQENIYIKCTDNTWTPWLRWIPQENKKGEGSKENIRQSHHPWLHRRFLQFDGTILEWNTVAMYKKSLQAWNAQRHVASERKYENLPVGWIARYIVARRHIDAVSGAASEPPQTPSRGTASTLEYMDNPVPNVLSTEASSTSLIPKRARSDSLPSQLEQRSPKRARRGDDDIDTQRDQGDQTIEQYLTGLPMSLAHHTQLLATLGITDLSYFRSLAGLTRPVMDEAMTALQQHGITFLESLVLRTALHARRRTSAPHVESHATMAAFLAHLHPHMGRHAPAFEELGIAVGAIPVLAQLDGDSYAVFERALSAKGLTWVEALFLKAGIQEHVRVLA